MEFENQGQLEAAVAEQNKYLSNTIRRLTKLSKALKALSGGKALSSASIFSVAQELQQLKPEEVDLSPQLSTLGKALAAYESRERNARRLAFVAELREVAKANNMRFEQITSQPAEYRLGLFTVLVDFSKGEATICYARLPLLKTSIAADLVMQELKQAKSVLSSGSPKAPAGWEGSACASGSDSELFQPAYFFHLLYTAYRRVANLLKVNDGRVPIVELLPEMSFLTQSEAFRKKPSKKSFVPYEREQLAWDIARLRHSAQGLEYGGKRLNLGVATLKATSRKSNVLYIEDAGGVGQYYASLWFS